MSRLLLVEDSETCQVVVQRALSGPGTELKIAGSYAAAMKILDSGELFELVLLDLILPDGNGLEILSHMRMADAYRDVPVFLLTTKEDIASKVSAFSLGADDYLTKPINPTELRARVDMRLRKAKAHQRELEILRRGDLTINLPMMQVQMQVEQKAEAVELTAKEFKILAFLAQNEGKVFSRSELVNAIWGAGTHVVDRTVDSHICGLRRKIGGCSRYIESIPGAGYRFQTGPSAC